MIGSCCYFWSLNLSGLLHSPFFVHTIYGGIEITAMLLASNKGQMPRMVFGCCGSDGLMCQLSGLCLLRSPLAGRREHGEMREH